MRIRSILAAALLGLAVMAAPSIASAQQAQTTINTDGLPADKVKQIQQIVDSAKQTSTNLSDIASKVKFDKDTVQGYADMGKAIGTGIANAAKELGVAANEFAGTLPGKVALFLLVYNLGGAEIAGRIADVGIGILWFTVLLTFWSKYFRKICLAETTTTETTKRFVRNEDNSIKKDPQGNDIYDEVTTTITKGLPIDDGAVAGTRLIMVLILAFASLPGLFFIF